MVEFRGVSKGYARAASGRVDALADASFRVEAGELVVVAGPSGAGKSTLIRLACGEERPTRGTVLVAGVDLGGLRRGALAELRRRLGVVPQDGRLLPDRTVFGNVALVLQALGVPRGEVRPRTLEALREVGLGQRLTARPAELAHGERQRCLLARALAPGPDLLLADEPAGATDEATTDALLAVLRAVQARGTAVLVATVRPDLAKLLGARALALEGGRLAREGDPG